MIFVDIFSCCVGAYLFFVSEKNLNRMTSQTRCLVRYSFLLIAVCGVLIAFWPLLGFGYLPVLIPSAGACLGVFLLSRANVRKNNFLGCRKDEK